jgi:tetratricopeptide (TPR) repeat protein
MDTLTLALFIELLLVAGTVGPMHYGANMVRAGRFQQALPILRAYYAASRLLPRWRGPLAGFLCACYVGMGEFALAQPYAEEAVRENSKYNYPQHLASARAHLGIILIHQGDFDQAAPLIDETLKATIPARLRPTVELFAANGYINLDRQEEAEKLILEVMANAKPGSDIHIVALANLSQCRLLQGRAEEALDIARQAAKPKAPNANIRFAVLRGLLVCLIEMDLLDEAQAVAAQITPDLNKMDAFRQGAALRALAELALKMGDLDRARDLAQRSSTLGINPNAHANTLLIQAQVFAAHHNAHRAMTLCHDILETRSVRFYKLRAQELIDRLEAPDTLANSPAQKYVTEEYVTEEEETTAWTANPELP